jgi:hypothetical protein
MTTFALRFVLWLLASPILFGIWIARVARRIRFWRISYAPSLLCRNCGESISLVGLWKDGCGFTYKGHLLRYCAICASIPRVVRCVNCQVTTKLPEPE